MSTIQTQKDWQPEPPKTLVGNFPVGEGTKFYEQKTQIRCIVCSTPKIPTIFDREKNPLVLACPKCGHKSWAKPVAQ